MKIFEDELEKQAYYERLKAHKKTVNKKRRVMNDYEEYSKDSLDNFLQGIYDMAMNGNGIKLNGVFIG